jgi:hypothetical protein
VSTDASWVRTCASSIRSVPSVVGTASTHLT